MTNQSNQTIPLPEFNPLLEANYEIFFFDSEANVLPINPWDVRSYSLTFDQKSAELVISVTGLLQTYELDQFRAIKIIKIKYINDVGDSPSDYTFEVTGMSGRTQGNYISGHWMEYQIHFNVK